jgi:L-ascorbate metabolism protein UlaG (beta-lactamase superfamily)
MGEPARPLVGVDDNSVQLALVTHVHLITTTQMRWTHRYGPRARWPAHPHATRIFHGGDTMWHGHWWKIARRLGPVDLAFLPINGALVQFPGLDPSGIPASLTPQQAAAAANLLGAAVTCPIHYNLFNNPPVYVDSPGVEAAFLAETAKRGLQVWLAHPGEVFDRGKD